MHIAVDATAWHNTRGYGRFTRSLLTRLAALDASRTYTYISDSGGCLEGLPARIEVRRIATAAPTATAAAANSRRSLGDLWRVGQALSAAEFDLVVFPTVYSYVPVLSRARKIVFIHDVIAERYPQLTLPQRKARLFWQVKVALARRQADALVTVSDFSRQAILDTFHEDPGRVFVVGEASDPVFRPSPGSNLSPRLLSLGILPESRAVVYVGGFGPHKNLGPLIEAFARLALKPDCGDMRLVLVGEYEREAFYSEYQALRAQVEACGVAGQVVFTGYLPDEELAGLLNHACVLALPSWMEGFGLPAVEAAACGCPVIATRNSPLPGLLGEGGLFIDPARPEEIGQALARVMGDPVLRLKMSAAGRQSARQLTWDQSARQLMDIFDRFENP